MLTFLSAEDKRFLISHVGLILIEADLLALSFKMKLVTVKKRKVSEMV